MNQHVIDTYNEFIEVGFQPKQIERMAKWFHYKVNHEHKETMLDLILYAQTQQQETIDPLPGLKIESGPYHMKTTNHQPPTINY